MQRDLIQLVATMLVLFAWPVYLAVFLRPPSTPRPAAAGPAQRDAASIAGVVLQFSAVGVVWAVPRRLFSGITEVTSLAAACSVMAVLLSAAAVWVSFISRRELGANWNFVATVRPEHVLIQSGPYRFVRHPLYAGFFGLTAATAIVWSHPFVMPFAFALFLLGVWIRMRVEERLLLHRFGPAFSEYKDRVPALFPLRIVGRR